MLNLKQKIKLSLSLILLVVLFAEAGNVSASSITSDKMLELTNESRNDAGLGSLTIDDKLVVAAKAKADDMFLKQYFEHNSPEGLTPWYWFNYAGYEYVYAAENLAIDFVTAEGAHSALMKSTGHRDNILGKNYQEVGIAVIEGEFEGRETTIIVEEFGSRREPKITINNATFFEENAEVKSALVEMPDIPVPVSPETKKVKPYIEDGAGPNKEIATQAVIVSEPVQETEEMSSQVVGNYDLTDVQAIAKPLDDITGMATAKVYAVRQMSQLKKVYTEDIYWERAEGNDIVDSLGVRTMRLRILIRDFTNGLLYINANLDLS